MNNWKEENNTLIKTFEFTSFEEAMLFMQDATPFISKTDHHPTWSNTYNRITVTLCTHDSGNQVTEKDHALATYLDKLFNQ